MSLFKFMKPKPEDIFELITEKRKAEDWEIYVKPLKYENLEFSILPQLKCFHCGYFGRSHQCPPYIPPYYWWREKLKQYNVFFLVVGKANVKDRVEEEIRVYNQVEWRAKFYAGNEYSTKMKYLVNNFIEEKVKLLKSLGVECDWFETGGGCRKCRPCAVLSNKRCKKPDKARPSPEAIGIDVYKLMLKYDEIEIPPVYNYRMVGLICVKLDYDFEPPKPKPIKIDYEIPFEPLEVWDTDKIYVDQDECKCDKYSPLICKRLFKKEDLLEFLRDKKLYAVKLNEPMTNKEGINELYDYALQLHRQGVYWVFHLWSSRCSMCPDCNLEYHREHGYKIVQNRRVPRCVKFFNLDPPLKGERIGYILL